MSASTSYPWMVATFIAIHINVVTVIGGTGGTTGAPGTKGIVTWYYDQDGWTQRFGGTGGVYGYYLQQSGSLYITEICAAEDAFVHALKLTWNDGSSIFAGGLESAPITCHTVNPGQCFTKFALVWGNWIDTLQFTTSDGYTTPNWGGTGGTQQANGDGDFRCISRIYIEYAQYIDRIQFYFLTTPLPTIQPTGLPSRGPTDIPTLIPSLSPSNYPTLIPSDEPTYSPSRYSTESPSQDPTYLPSHYPSQNPTNIPTDHPSYIPSYIPTISPTELPSQNPTYLPSIELTKYPSQSPSYIPSLSPIESMMTKLLVSSTVTEDIEDMMNVPTLIISPISDMEGGVKENITYSGDIIGENVYDSDEEFQANSMYDIGTKIILLLILCICICIAICCLIRLRMFKKNLEKSTTDHNIDSLQIVDSNSNALSNSNIISNEINQNVDGNLAVMDTVPIQIGPKHEKLDIDGHGDDNTGNITNGYDDYSPSSSDELDVIPAGTTSGYNYQDRNDNLGNYDHDDFKRWVDIQLRLPQYYDLFVINGYDSIEMIKEIQSISDLQDIGISDEEEQMLILNRIIGLQSIVSKR